MPLMPALTRRRSTDAREECWHIYYGDVQAGTIAIRSRNPQDEDPWEWYCGFYPGSHPGEHQNGTAATFEEARADFESAWQVFLSKRTEARFSGIRAVGRWQAALIAPRKATGSTNQFACPVAASLSPSKMHATISPNSPRPITRRRNGRLQWKP